MFFNSFFAKLLSRCIFSSFLSYLFTLLLLILCKLRGINQIGVNAFKTHFLLSYFLPLQLFEINFFLNSLQYFLQIDRQ